MEVWVLRESFLAYERFHGVFTSKIGAQTKSTLLTGKWLPIKRSLPSYMWDDMDPFDSPQGSESIMIGDSLWVVEPYTLVLNPTPTQTP